MKRRDHDRLPGYYPAIERKSEWGGINRRDPRERASKGYLGRVWEVKREPREVDMVLCSSMIEGMVPVF